MYWLNITRAVSCCRRAYSLSMGAEFLKERRGMWICPGGEELFVRPMMSLTVAGGETAYIKIFSLLN